MENLKNWKTTSHTSYAFSINDKALGTLEIFNKNFKRTAIFKIENKTYYLEYKGFWKSNYIIFDENRTVIVESSNGKWYSTVRNLNYKNKIYKLKIRNNPLAEFVIFDDETEILSYGLSTNNGKVNLKIKNLPNNTDYLLDFLIWYNFYPIALENGGDNFIFQTVLITA